MEINCTAPPAMIAYSLRDILKQQEQTGAYSPHRGPMNYQTLSTPEDLRHLSTLYGLTEAYNFSNGHIKLILGAEKLNSTTKLVQYDPLVGITEAVLNNLEPNLIIFSPKMHECYHEMERDTWDIYNDDGSSQGLHSLDFLTNYFRENPTSEMAMDYFRNMSGIQYNPYDCGLLSVHGALIKKWATLGLLPPYRINSTDSEDDSPGLSVYSLDGTSSNSEGDHLDFGTGTNTRNMGYPSEGLQFFDPIEDGLVFYESEDDGLEFNPQTNRLYNNQNLFGRFQKGIRGIEETLGSLWQPRVNRTSNTMGYSNTDSSSGLAFYNYY